ncbi:MAG: AbrB/MazE/SpoVT family DNA-binding domain-containing protein [Caulobacterales bacterium]|nr:AbrB/MazE/SpoVT family DNA-binding domain-containing protein [Caulobacterales bacterium]
MGNDTKLPALVSTKGRVTLPAELRRKLNWRPGIRLTIEETEDGVLLNAAPSEPDSQDVEAAAGSSRVVSRGRTASRS